MDAGLNSENFASSDAAAVNPLGNALAALGRRDYATAKWLFEALGRKDAVEAIEKALAALDHKDYATAQGLFEALAPATFVAPAMGLTASAPAGAGQHQSGLSPIKVIPFADAAYRRPAPPAEKAKKRGLKRVLLGTGLVLLLPLALYGPRLDGTFTDAKARAIASLASAVDLVKTPLAAIAGHSAREEERSAMRDLSAGLTQVTTRLDQIEHEYGARLDKLGERLDQNSSSTSAAVAAVPVAPASEFADVVARLDKLEKRVVVAAAPASELADIRTRLDRLEKRAAVPAVSSAKPFPTATPKQSTLMARAEPSASNEIARPDNPRPLLRDYSVEDVQDGIALVHSRSGPQQVAPGDVIPGAGRVLRIERRGGKWFVLTSLGVIASGQNGNSQE